MPRLDLVDDHLRRAQDAEPYVAFDAAWKAFNVLYEAEHAPGQPNRESDLIGRAVLRLAPVASGLLDRADIDPFLAVDPIFDEKKWERAGVKDHNKHATARARLQGRTRGSSTVEDLQALVEALYVVRCNLAHGFKAPDGPRDREVLSVAAPIAIELARALRATW